MNYNNDVKKASVLGIFGNIFLLICKFIVGFMFKSNAIIADAVNSAGDIFASIMAYIGNKISSHPADDNHNMGHGKAEYIFSLFIGISMIIASILVVYDCVNSLLSGSKYIFSIYLIFVCILTILTKYFLYLYTKKLYKKSNSILIKSLYIDHRNDMFVTLSILISTCFSFFNIYIVDSITGILISCLIIKTGIHLFLESLNVLMDKSLDEEDKLLIKDIVSKYDNILKIGNFSSMPIGNKYILVLTIYVNPKMTVKKAHDLTKLLQEEILKKIGVIDRVIIHVNPLN